MKLPVKITYVKVITGKQILRTDFSNPISVTNSAFPNRSSGSKP